MPDDKDNTARSAIPSSSSQLGSRAAQRVEQINNHIGRDLAQSEKNTCNTNIGVATGAMQDLPSVRRIVTDHTPDGKAIFGQDEILTPANPLDPKGGAVPKGR